MADSKGVGGAGVDSEFSESVTDAKEFLLGFERVKDEVKAVVDKDIATLNLDVPSAMTMALGSLPEILALRGEMAALPGTDTVKIDKIRDYAYALGHAHSLYRAAKEPSDEASVIAEAVSALRDLLHADATALVARGLLDENQVAKLKTGPGYKNLAFDLVGLVQLFREAWPRIAGRSAVELAELDRAGALASELVTAVGLREQAPALISAAHKLRQQAFTLFVQAYDEARRAVLYLRWHHEDADQIAPSLYSGRNTRPGAKHAADNDTTDPAPIPGSATGGMGISGSVGSASPVASNGSAVPVGMPGSSPFLRS